jgi:hypothetical protein
MPKPSTKDPRTVAELRLRDAAILLRIYMKHAPHLTELNGRTTRWMNRHLAKAKVN